MSTTLVEQFDTPDVSSILVNSASLQPIFHANMMEVQMTQEVSRGLRSIFDRLFPATPEPPIAFDGPSGIFEDEPSKDDERRIYQDENYYWGWCMYGHW